MKKVIIAMCVLVASCSGQKNYWPNYDGTPNGESEPNGWAIAQRVPDENRPSESQQQVYLRQSEDDEQTQTWTPNPGETEPEMNNENGWSNDQERYVVQGQDDEKMWVKPRGESNQEEEKVWVNRPRNQQTQDEEKVWVNRQREQPDEQSYDHERYFVQQHADDDSSGQQLANQEKSAKDTSEGPVYNDGPNTERHRYVGSQQPSQEAQEQERPVNYVTRNQWAGASGRQEEDSQVKLYQSSREAEEETPTRMYPNNRPTEENIKYSSRPSENDGPALVKPRPKDPVFATQRPQAYHEKRQSQSSKNNLDQQNRFVYRRKPESQNVPWKQNKQQTPQSESNDANSSNWPRAKQMEVSNYDESPEQQKRERILQLLQELQRLQLETMQESSSKSAKGNVQYVSTASENAPYWSNNQGSESRPQQFRYGEGQVIPWSRIPRMAKPVENTSPEIKKLAKVLANEIINKQESGRHNHLHSRINPEHYSKLKYGQARSNKQGGVTISWSPNLSNEKPNTPPGRPTYDAQQALYKSSGSSPTWSTAQLKSMYGPQTTQYQNTKKKSAAGPPEVNVVEIAIPLVNSGLSEASERGKINSASGQINYGGLTPAFGRALIENSVAKLVEQYVKDTAAAVMAAAVKKEKSTKRLIPVLISLDKRSDSGLHENSKGKKDIESATTMN